MPSVKLETDEHVGEKPPYTRITGCRVINLSRDLSNLYYQVFLVTPLLESKKYKKNGRRRVNTLRLEERFYKKNLIHSSVNVR
jgi:hypothetical protein